MRMIARYLIVILCSGASLLLLSPVVKAEARVPDWAAISVNPNGILLEFNWNESNGPIGFHEDEGVEFEVLIDPKCYAEPFPDGKDDNVNRVTQHNIPGLYTDIWNYWTPQTDVYPPGALDIITQIQRDCSGAEDFNYLQLFSMFIALITRDFADEDANFAVGIKRAANLRPGIPYFFFYPTQAPIRAACASSAGEPGFAWVRMSVFKNSCTLPWGTARLTCPHVIGFPPDICTENTEAQGPLLINRLCVPTNRFDWFLDTAQQEEVNRQNESKCKDDDGDGVFAVQPQRMFGSNVGDCNDADVTIQNEYYIEETGLCLANCDPTSCLCPPWEYCDIQNDCTCVACESSERDCSDLMDEDCDGLFDCDDPDCSVACGFGNAAAASLSEPLGGSYLTGEYDVIGTASDLDGLDKVSVALSWGSGYSCVYEICDGNCPLTSTNINLVVNPQDVQQGCNAPNGAHLSIAVWVRDITQDTDGPLAERVVTWYEPDFCGDGVVDSGEDCDSGNLAGGSCSSLGYSGGALGCTSGCQYDTSNCIPFCGNGTIDPGEDCDGSLLGGATCQTHGFPAGTLSCSGACQYDTSACADCVNGQTESQHCVAGTYCPYGATEERQCTNGTWDAWGVCEVGTSYYRYYGDAFGPHCGSTICLELPLGGNSTTPGIITKFGGGKFDNDVSLSIIRDSTQQRQDFGCVSTANESLYQFNISPAILGALIGGGHIEVRAEVTSPCVGGGTYSSGNGQISQCRQ